MTRLLTLTAWLALGAATATAAQFHIAPTGRDTNPGTAERPFATFDRAVRAVRDLKSVAGLPRGGVTIWIGAGSYELAAPIELTEADSGSAAAPITYRAAGDQVVRLLGGRRVTRFRAVTDGAVRKRLDPAARSAVVRADLKACGVNDLGSATADGKRLELFFGGTPMTLARWPNEDFARVVDVAGKTPHTIHGIRGTKEGRLIYAGERPRRWLNEPDLWLHGYWFWDWSDSYQKVASIDPQRHTLELAPPDHSYGYRKGQRYYALNALAELDVPGEWYVDRAEGILYFWPPGPLSESETLVSLQPKMLQLRGCHHVTVRGLTFEACRSDAITIEGGSNCLIAGCTLRNIGGRGVVVAGGTGHRVVGCDIFNTGQGGLSLSGGNRQRLVPARHAAENNHIHHFSRLHRTYRPAIGVQGVGIRVAHNLIHDGPHTAILLGGNDHMIELNEIHHVCYETGDVGAFYMGRDWSARGTQIRNNYFHDIKGPGLHGAMAVYLDDSASGTTIFGNIFCRAGRAAFIGGGRDNLVDNNVFVDCQSSVHVDARGVGWMRSTVETTLPQRLAAVPYRKPPWRDRYPQLLTLLEDDPGLPKGNVIRHNISVGGKWLDVEKAAAPLLTIEDNLVDKDPHFVDRPGDDFRLKKDSPAFALGFQPIPVDRIGLTVDDYRKSL